MDLSVLLAIQNLRNPIGDFLFPIITYMGSGGIIWILLSMYYIFIKKDRKTGVTIIIALILVSIVCLGIIKPIVHRARPFEVYNHISLIIKKPADYSFPSGHTSSSIAAVTVLYLLRKKSFVPFLVIAVLISFSRMYLFVHYPSDILVGALFGLLFGYLAVTLSNKYFPKFGREQL